MKTAEIEKKEEGCLALTGVLTFDTVVSLRLQLRDILSDANEFCVDLEKITYGDSAGLALLTDLYRFTSSLGKTISYINVPVQMRAIADVTGISALLPLTNK